MDITDIKNKINSKDPEELVKKALAHFGKGRIALASSLGMEDQVLTHMVLEAEPKARVFVLDTGRMFQETYDVMQETASRYDFHYEVYFPDTAEVEKMLREQGPNLFYYSVENRKLCCHIRKVLPLRRVLSTVDAWICGIRREQSVTRTDAESVEWDEANNIVKISPLIDWDMEKLKSYIKEHHIPVNSLHSKGYPSIGCLPCTRAVKEGEDQRAGRWWWENADTRECGLHQKKSGGQ